MKGTVSGSVHTSKLCTLRKAPRFCQCENRERGGSQDNQGNAKVADRIELLSSSRILGDLECKVLVVEAGAIIHGKVAMGADAEEIKPEKKTSFGRVKNKVVEKEPVISDIVQ